VIVCGGGLTGIELTSEIAETYPGLSITMVTRDPLGPNLSRKGYAYLHDYFAKRKVDVREGVTVQEVLPDGVLTTTGERIPADFTIWLGSFAVSSLARESGFAVNRIGQITVDQHLRSTSHPDVFAVGDAADSGVRMACATAMPLGAHAADNLAAILNGQPLKPFRFGFNARCISLGRRNALVQIVNADDSPVDKIFSGRGAAIFKELICRYTTASIHWTRRFPNAFMWTQPADAPQLPQPAPHPQSA
jgi:NADH dehydrogenase FAD-containing subunit